MNGFNDQDYLLKMAQLQDSLLQTYRSFHLTFQTIFIAIGIGLTAAMISIEEFPKLTLARGVIIFFLVLFWIIRSIIARKMVTAQVGIILMSPLAKQ